MSNLPPGVTPGDIDRHFGAPDRQVIHGTVHVGVTIEVPVGWSDREIRSELMDAVSDELPDTTDSCILHAEVEEIE